MREKLSIIVGKTTGKIIYFGDKGIIVEEKFNNLVMRYRITSVFMEDEETFVNYICCGEDTFIHTSPVKYLSNNFLNQIITVLT